MIDTNVQQVERWFAQTASRLSALFPETHFHVRDAADRMGRVTIQMDSPLAGASIWNKGDVEALVPDKVHDENITFDDRILCVDENISSLLQSYLEELTSLLKDLEKGWVCRGDGDNEQSGSGTKRDKDEVVISAPNGP